MDTGTPNQGIDFVFFGHSRFSQSVLETLKARGYLPRAVVTKHASDAMRWAERNGVEIIIPEHSEDEVMLKKLRSFDVKFFIVAAYSKLPQSVFTIPKHGTLNVHPSLLPKYRGACPEQAQILNDEQDVGVTIHLIDEEFDHGPIVAQKKITIEQYAPHASDLGIELTIHAGNLLADALPKLVRGDIQPVPQDDQAATYTRDTVPNQPVLIPLDDSPREQYKRFRALGRSPGVFFEHRNDAGETLRIFVKGAYFRNQIFIVTSVGVNNKAYSYDEFLDEFGLVDDPSWNAHSAKRNGAVASHIDMNSDDPCIRLREAIFQHVIVYPGEAKIVEPTGKESNESWLFDFRNILMRSEYMNLIADIFWQRYADLYPFQVGGQEVAAIPMICAIALKGEQLGKPVNSFFVRKSRKKTGMQRAIEGELTDDRIILVDDLMNFGTTQLRQIELLEEEGRNVSDVFVITLFRTKDTYHDLLKRNIRISHLFTPKDFGLSALPTPELPQLKSEFVPLWKFESADPNFFHVVPKSAPIADKDKIYFGSDNGIFWAINQEDGSVAWKFKIWRTAQNKAIFSSPALYENTVYFGAYDGHVYALDTTTGKKRWDYWDADWIGSSPALAPDLNLLFVGLEFGLIGKRGGIVALDASTGVKRWEHIMPGLTHASPAYSKKYGVVGVGCNDGVFRMFNAKKGTLLWECATGEDVKSSAVFDEQRGYVLFGSFDGHIYVCDVQTGEIKHKFVTDGPIYSTPLVHGRTAYITSLDKRLYAVDLDTFNEKWRFETSGRIFTNPEIIDGHIYIGSNDGFLYEISEEGKMSDFFSTRERIVNNVAYNATTKRFFLLTHANELYCLKKSVN